MFWPRPHLQARQWLRGQAWPRSRTILWLEVLEDKILPATFSVTSLLDSGAGSLRAAITSANTTPGPDTIRFNVAGTIGLTSDFPAITGAVTIDGWTAPGFKAAPVVELNGAAVTNGTGLTITGSNVTLRGLAINRFASAQVRVSGPLATSGNTIVGNYIGTNLAGTASAGPSGVGVQIEGGADNTVVGSNGDGVNDANERNIISGNSGTGVTVTDAGTDGNVVAGNFIGLVAAGTTALANGGYGVRIANGATNTRVGTDGSADAFNTAERNVISGNVLGSVEVTGLGTAGTILAGNFLGTDASGTAAFSQPVGVRIASGATGTTVGSATAAYANRIRGFTTAGVQVQDASINNAILGNSIVGTSGLAIDLGTVGRDLNDSSDADTGANNLQNRPSITRATIEQGAFIVRGGLRSHPNQPYRIELFASDADAPPGSRIDDFVGLQTVTTDASGNATFAIVATVGVMLPNANFRYFAATATHLGTPTPDGTSEVSDTVKAVGVATLYDPGDPPDVESTVDGVLTLTGPLREDEENTLQITTDTISLLARISEQFFFDVIVHWDFADPAVADYDEAFGEFATYPGPFLDVTYPVVFPDQWSGWVRATVDLYTSADGEIYHFAVNATSSVTTISPVPDRPVATVVDPTIETTSSVWTPIGVDVSPSADQDGSEKHGLILTGFPTGTQFSAGIPGSSGRWFVPPNQVAGLAARFPSGSFTLTATPRTSDAGTATEWPDAAITVAVTVMLGMEVVATPTVIGSEDADAIVGFELRDVGLAGPPTDDGLYRLTVTATGGLVNGGTGFSTQSASLAELNTIVSALRVSLPPQAHGGVTVTVDLVGGGRTATGTTRVIIQPVPDEPPLTLPPADPVVIYQNVATPLGLALGLSADTDGSESQFVDIDLSALGGYEIVEEYIGDDDDGNPIYNYYNEYYTAFYTLSAGTDVYNDGRLWRVPRSDLPGLTLIVASYFPPDRYDATITPYTLDAGVPRSWNPRTLRLDIRNPAASGLDGVSMDDTYEDSDATVQLQLRNVTADGIRYNVLLETAPGLFRVSASDADRFNVTIVEGNNTAALRVSGSLPNLQALFDASSIRFVPTAGFSGTVALTATLAAPSDAFVTATNTGRVYPDADSPAVNFGSPIGLEGLPGGTVDLDLSFVPSTDQDGSETHTIEIWGLPPGSVLSAGTDPTGSGVWLVNPADLSTLTLTLRADTTAGNFILGFRAHTEDFADFTPGGDDLSSATWELGTLAVTVLPVYAPTVEDVGPFDVDENDTTPIPFDLDETGNTGDVSGTYSAIVTATNGVLLGNAGLAANFRVELRGNGTDSLELEGTLLALRQFLAVGGLEYAPAAYFSGNATVGLTLSAPDGASDSTTSAVRIHPVASIPVLTAPSVTGWKDTTIPVPIDLGSLPDVDGSETVTLTISVPLSTVTQFVDAGGAAVGTEVSSGVWEFTAPRAVDLQAILTGLRVQLVAGFVGTFDMDVTVRVDDVAVVAGTTELDTADASDSIGVTALGTGDPEVLDRGSYSTLEDNPLAITYALDDNDDPGGVYTVRILATRGTVAIVVAADVTIESGNGTADLRLRGTLTALRAQLDAGPGVVFTPDGYYSGPATVALTLTAPNGVSAAATSNVRVKPVAGTPTLTVSDVTAAVGETPIPVPITLTGLTDPDGSEIADVTIDDATGTVLGFVNSAGTPVGVSDGPSRWLFSAASFAELQAVLADLRVVVAPGNRDSFSVDVKAAFTDTVAGDPYTDAKTVRQSLTVTVAARPATVTLAPVTEGVEGSAWVVAFAVSDPDLSPSDDYPVTLTLTTPLGVWTGVDPAALAANGVFVDGLGMGTLTASGRLFRLQAFFTSASIVNLVNPHFAGAVPNVTVTYTNTPASRTATATTTVRVLPVASTVTPTVSDADGNEEAAISLAMTVPATPDVDGSEVVAVVVRGVPAEARLSRGTDLGGGTWRVAVADLTGLTITPPPLFAGTLALSAAAVVTDTVSFAPLVGSGTDVSESAPVPFTVTVRLVPTTVVFVGGSVTENSATGTPIGQLSTSGGHAGETFTFQFVASTGYDVTVAADGSVRVGSQVPDYEMRPGFDLTVVAIGSRGTRQTQTYPIVVTNENEPPAIVGGLVVAREDTPAAVTGLAVSDPDIGARPVRVRLAVDHGTITVAAGVGVTLTDNGMAAVTLDGPLAAVNATLAASDGVTYRPAADYSSREALTVTADDLGGTGAGGPNVVQAVRTFTVDPVADTPLVATRDLVFDEGGNTAAGFSATSGDRDGSESLSVALFGVPEGIGLNRGQYDPARSAWMLTPDEFAALRLSAVQDTDDRPAEMEVVVSSREANGSTAETRTTFRVTVRNVAPELVGVILGPQVDGHATVDLGTLSDPGQEPFWGVEVDWGDDLVELWRADDTGPLGTRSHAYSAPGRYTIHIAVSDDDTNTSTDREAEWVVLTPVPTPTPTPEEPVPPITPAPVVPPPTPEPLPTPIAPTPPPAPATPPIVSTPEPTLDTPATPPIVPTPEPTLDTPTTPPPATPTLTTEQPASSVAGVRVISLAPLVGPAPIGGPDTPSNSVATTPTPYIVPTSEIVELEVPSEVRATVGIAGGSSGQDGEATNQPDTLATPVRANALTALPTGGTFATVTAATLASGEGAPPNHRITLALLDPTAPQAGFGDTYGESFELFDRMTRENVVSVSTGDKPLAEVQPLTATVPVPTADDVPTSTVAPAPPPDTDTSVLWGAVVGLAVAAGVVAYRPAWSARVFRMIRGWFAHRTTP